ncbi:MAG TPA: SpoIID/LytB domain-containing protein, partial [Candidatus Caenarcaniphilales bacterium]
MALESYLYSVVGGEMPAYWPLEALKAQAIAARSYALVHLLRPAHALYDLGATTRWQQYEGIQAEANTTQAAVNQTRGLLLSDQGGVVESMYAASEAIVTEVFGGRGMSQTGAHKLAMQGYDYLHILGAYYPGT